jgi:hypothetical protein
MPGTIIRGSEWGPVSASVPPEEVAHTKLTGQRDQLTQTPQDVTSGFHLTSDRGVLSSGMRWLASRTKALALLFSPAHPFCAFALSPLSAAGS